MPLQAQDLVQVKHGYTLRDLQGITSTAVRRDRVGGMDFRQRWDIAWEGVIDALYDPETDQPPSRPDLIQAGWQAIYRHVRLGLRERGHADHRDSSVTGPSMPRFVAYWTDRAASPQEEQVVERVAVWQVVAALRPAARDAIVAFAACGDEKITAERLRISRDTLIRRLTQARRNASTLWHEGETPILGRDHKRPRRKPLDTHCSKGHEWTPENTRVQRRMFKSRVRLDRCCRVCERSRQSGGDGEGSASG